MCVSLSKLENHLMRRNKPRTPALTKYCVFGGVLIMLVLAAGCSGSNSFLRKKKTSQDIPLPPGIVAPREKLQNWQKLVKSATSPSAKSNVARQLEEAFLKEDDPQLRAELLRLMGQLNLPPSDTLVERAKSDEEPSVRIQLCHLLAKSPSGSAVSVLSELALNDRDQDVRQAAIKALGRLHDPRANQVLAQLLRNRDPAIQYLAVQSLKQTTGKDFGMDLKQWEAYVYGGTPAGESQPALAEKASPRY
jgi:hypothetical protein